MSMSRPQVRRPARVVVVSLVLAGGLSGCGVAGTDFQPGVAAKVGDATISTREVNAVTSSYCSSIETQLAENNQVLPLRYLRAGVVGQLALVAAARQLARQYDVKAGSDYTRQVADLEDAVAALPQEQADAVLAVGSSATYLASVQAAVGAKALADRGKTGADQAAAGAEGQKLFAAWLDDHHVELDPQFGVAIEDAQVVPTDDSLSFPAGRVAKLGGADTPDQAYATSLPDSLRCG